METYNTYIPPKSISAPGIAGNSDIKKSAKDFEAMFVSEMFRPIMENEGEDMDPMFGGGETQKIYKSMLVNEYGKEIAKAGGIGLAQHIEKELLRLQEAK